METKKCDRCGETKELKQNFMGFFVCADCFKYIERTEAIKKMQCEAEAEEYEHEEES